jgi:hypothetical protein
VRAQPHFSRGINFHSLRTGVFPPQKKQ